jgi:hypothetical protein
MLRVLEIIAGSWPIAFMFFAATVGLVLLTLIYFRRKDRKDELNSRISLARDVTTQGNKTWQD